MYKLVLAVVVGVTAVVEVSAHRNALSSPVVSSDSEVEEFRRNMVNEEWQFEGLPIEFPSRRHLDTDTTKKHSENHKSGKKGKKSLRRGRDKKFKGLPIEIPARRHMKNTESEETQPTTTITTTKTTTSTTPAPNPPLDPRYRRIYNPDEVATVRDFPFMAALLVNGELWCGAVVIAADSVLTAAHCLQLQYNNRFFREYVKMLSIRVGSNNASFGGELLRVSEIYFHPNYKPQTLSFNVALLKVQKNMTFGKDDLAIDKIRYSRDKVVPVDDKILFLGWGSVMGAAGSGGQVLLQKLELPVYDLADCQEVYGRELVTRNNFCAGYITIAKNVCNHDAGGPAIMNGALIGILSFSSKRCDQADQPAVFSSVGAIAPWIEQLGEKKFQLRNTAIKST